MRSKGTVYFRGQVAWIRYTHPVKGRMKPLSTGLRRDTLGEAECKRQARAVLDQIFADIDAGIAVKLGPLTFAEFAERVCAKRKRGRTELGRMRKHAPELLNVPLTEIDSERLMAWIKRLCAAKMPGRTVLHIWSAVRQVLIEAVVKKHIPGIPVLRAGTLPPKKDSDPKWRSQAIFTLAECERLMFDERLPLMHRVLYGCKAATGARHGEVVGLTWGMIDWTAEPRPSVTFAVQYDGDETKTGATKIVPLHPALETLVKQWRAHVTERDGREPGPDDRVITDDDGKVFDEYEVDTNDHLIADLETLGFRTTAGTKRRRGGHDFRRTFLSELRRAKVERSVRRAMTHPPAVARESDEGYDVVSYEDKCEAIMRLRFRTLRTVAVPAKVAASGGGPAVSGYISGTSAEGTSEATVITDEFATTQTAEVGTVFPLEKGQGRTRADSSTKIRLVRGPDGGHDRSGSDPKCTDVPATADPLATLEAAARLILDAVAGLRRK